MNRNLHRLFAGLATFAGLGLAATQFAAHAQYPVKPIQVIVGTPPGAGTDLVARTVSDRLATRLGTSIVVDNRVGASGLIAAQGAKRAAADGHTLLFTNDSLVLSLALGSSQDINVLTDFQPIVLAATIDFLLAVNSEVLPANTPLDLVRIARERPGKLSFATPGVGAPHHLGMELFKQQTGVDIVHVPYKGMGPAMPDFLAGRVQVVMTGFPSVASHMKSGKLRILGSATAIRSPEHPDVPTLREGGVPNVEIQGYIYLVAPLGTPGAIVARLNSDANEILRMPQVQAELAKRGTQAAGGTPEQLAQKLRSEAEKWTRVVKTAGIKPE